ncbi:PTS system mannose/fructose/sorbose family transporter subunit IID [Secundilactobacillus odoratitofui]|uniref:PTS system mannose/fructose/sorbose family transporter subunit IID n=1 Tax=Secundilactobacillus odoratitofui TaxID=480930 RepID=UPI0034E240FE
MQNLGFVYVMMPAIKRLYDTPEDQRAAVLRHLGFFLTQCHICNPRLLVWWPIWRFNALMAVN